MLPDRFDEDALEILDCRFLGRLWNAELVVGNGDCWCLVVGAGGCGGVFVVDEKFWAIAEEEFGDPVAFGRGEVLAFFACYGYRLLFLGALPSRLWEFVLKLPKLSSYTDQHESLP